MRHWTTEERLKQSQLIQNWQPWNKSTGARTPEGKKASSMNAFKGGFKSSFRNILKEFKQQKDIMERFKF